jgi:hypothetical protein
MERGKPRNNLVIIAGVPAESRTEQLSESLEQPFSADVMRRVRRCAAGVWGKFEKKREENIEE